MEDNIVKMLSDGEEDHGVDSKIKSLTKTRFDEAKQIKQKRTAKLKYIRGFLDRLTNTVNTVSNYGESGNLSKGYGDQKFISPIATTIIEKKCSSDWIPTLQFEPEERFGSGADVYLARNSTRIFNFGLKIGKFKRACQDGAQDLFEYGRLVLQMGFLTRTASEEDAEFQKATFIRIRNKGLSSVYWTKDEHTIFIIEEFSLAELVDTFGEDIKKLSVKGGEVFDTSGDTLDFSSDEDLRKTVQVAHVYAEEEKIYCCQIGGDADPYIKMTGDRYPFTDEWGDGFIPVTFIDGSAIKVDGHPISDMDKILPICVNYDFIFQGVIQKAKKSSVSTDIIGSTNPTAQRKQYLQQLADQNAGLDIPAFMDIEEGSQLFAKTLDTPFDLNSPLAIRDAFLDEIMMATGVNLRLLGAGADTARQEELRMRRELEVIDEGIKVNEPNWEDFALHYMQMLKGVEADFYDEFVAIEDEISDKPNRLPAQGTVRDIIEQLSGFPFNVKVTVNQSNAKRKSLETSQKEAALAAIAPFAQGSIAVAKMSYDVATDKYPSLKFTEEDFLPQQPQENTQAGVPTEAPTDPNAALPALTK